MVPQTYIYPKSFRAIAQKTVGGDFPVRFAGQAIKNNYTAALTFN